MESTKYIGRVGALAVALGIGSALTCGTGVAWADEGSDNSGKTDSSTSGDDGKSKESGPTASTTGPAKAAKPTRRLSDVGERIRKDIESSSLDGMSAAVKRSQSRLDKARKPVGDNMIDNVTDKVTEATRQQGTRQQAAKPTRTTRKDVAADESAPANVIDVTPDAADTVPVLDRTRPRKSVVVTVAEATKDVTDTITNPVTKTVTDNRVPRVAAPVTKEVRRPVATLEALELPKAPESPAAPVVSALLAAAGLSPVGAGTSPVAPAPSPALWAMMAWTRRESERALNPKGTSLVSVTDAASTVAEADIQPMAAASTVAVPTNDLTPRPGVPASLTNQTTGLGWVTGPGVTDHWYVAGTDLGIMWNSGYTNDNGIPIIYTMFGDTYSGPGMTGDWRNNVLFRTSDTNLSNGLQFSDALIHAGAVENPPGIPTWWGADAEPAAGAAQIIYDPGYDGPFGTTYTMIPTSAIAIRNVNGTYTQYATVMSIRTWDNPGSWTTNYSAIAYSTDEGKSWTVNPNTVRSSGWLRSSVSYVPGDEHFQQNALVMSNNPDDPYVYVYGTPSGRQGSAYLARVKKDQITNLDAYQYWSGENSSGAGRWVTGDPSAAVPVFGSSSTDFLPRVYQVFDLFTFGFFSKVLNGIWVGGLPTNGNVSEMSVQYNEYLGKYVVLYTDGANDVVMRVSASPQGEWSDTTTLVSNNQTTNTGMYAPMVHPMSGTDYFNVTNADGSVEDNSRYLYYNLSYWGAYNVRLMRTNLEPMTTIEV